MLSVRIVPNYDSPLQATLGFLILYVAQSSTMYEVIAQGGFETDRISGVVPTGRAITPCRIAITTSQEGIEQINT